MPDFSVGTYLGTCSTAVDTAAKEATIAGYELQRKSEIVLTFTNGNTASNTTLNINNKGAKAIYYKGLALGTDVIKANDIVTLVYNGTQFEITNIERRQDYVPVPIDVTTLSEDYTFKYGDTLIIGTGLYRCTATTTTTPPFNFVFDANGSIVIESINGYEAVVVDSDTLNTGWEKVMDVSDRHYIEMRVNTKANKATTLAGYNIGDAYTKTQVDALTRHTRLTDFDLNTLKKAVADQNLEKYGLKVGDQKTINGHTYVIAGLNPMKGTALQTCTTNHVGLIVIPHTTQKWNASGNTSEGADGRGAGYMNCDLHYYLKNTVLQMCNTDLGASNLLGHNKLLSNSVTDGHSSSRAWDADCKICALSENQIYGASVCGNMYDVGEAGQQLEVFQRYKYTDIFGDEFIWLRAVSKLTYAASASSHGGAGEDAVSSPRYVAALILFH